MTGSRSSGQGRYEEEMSIEAVTARVQQILTMEQQLSSPTTGLHVSGGPTAGGSASYLARVQVR